MSKNSVFINLSNHPMKAWKNNQIQAIDNLFSDNLDCSLDKKEIGFPVINPKMSITDLRGFLETFLKENIEPLLNDYEKVIIHVMGEMGFTYNFISYCNLYDNVFCVHSTTKRIVIDEKPVFEFIQFREY